jgi:predicted enzyme related to lactoylglutathione lyase
MSEHEIPPSGSICYVELGVKDIDRAKRFYAELFGWEFFEMTGGYVSFKAPGGMAGGFNPEQEVGADGALAYLSCDGVTAKLGEMERLGGKILRPSEPLPENWGHIGACLDSEGNRLGLWSMAP